MVVSCVTLPLKVSCVLRTRGSLDLPRWPSIVMVKWLDVTMHALLLGCVLSTFTRTRDRRVLWTAPRSMEKVWVSLVLVGTWLLIPYPLDCTTDLTVASIRWVRDICIGPPSLTAPDRPTKNHWTMA